MVRWQEYITPNGLQGRDPYTSRVARTDPYREFLHAQEHYRRHIQSTDVTLKHSGTPRALVCTPATRLEQRGAPGAAAGGHRAEADTDAPTGAKSDFGESEIEKVQNENFSCRVV